MSINAITDLTVHTVTRTNSTTNIDLKFTKPTSTSGVGGYYLYISSTGVTYEYYDYKIDSSHQRAVSISTTTDDSGFTHFTSTITEDKWKGRLLYFKMIALDTLGIPNP